jgi:hypothetical protein
MSYKILPVHGRFEVYINGKFHCFADTMREVDKEINHYRHCYLN